MTTENVTITLTAEEADLVFATLRQQGHAAVYFATKRGSRTPAGSKERANEHGQKLHAVANKIYAATHPKEG